MKSAKRILAVLLCAALLISVLCACGKTAGTGTDTDTNDDSIAQQLYDADVAAPDLTNATEITLSGADDVTITDGGVYVLTGTLTDGRVLVNAPGADVTLVLRDADITCVDSSALYIYKAANVLVYLPDGTASTLTDGSSYDDSGSFSSTTDEEPNACLYAKSDLIIAGGGVAWLYRSATPDMLPEVKVTFDGQELAPTAYKWHVPVVGSFFRRTYAETLNSSPVVLEDAISDASPDIIVTPSDYSTQLTITDADKETVYEGSVTGFRSYLFAENGTFDAKLVVTASDSAAEDRSSVTGTETWQFRFTVGIKPSVTLCTPTVQQGSVAAVRVGSTMSRTEPTLTGPLESTGFVRAANGWICYLPIPWNAETGNTELTVTADGYTETLTLSVRAASYSYKDYSAKSQLTSPYIGADDAPDAVRRLLTTDGGEIQWAVGGFVQPFLDSFDTPLLYGMTEYVGRSYSERSTNYGYGGRTSTNVVIKPKKSKDSMIVPASGHVLLAEDLGGSYGYTVVIDHGAGLRSIFYGLTALDVEAGDDVKQGQLLGTSGRTVVADLRIGTVPINPLLVWRGQCDGLKYY